MRSALNLKTTKLEFKAEKKRATHYGGVANVLYYSSLKLNKMKQQKKLKHILEISEKKNTRWTENDWEST